MVYNASIQYGHKMVSQMLHFPSSSLLNALGKYQRIVQVLGFLLLWEAWMKLLASGHLLALIVPTSSPSSAHLCAFQ